MYKNNHILVGRNETNDACLLLNKANRHGLITGASGSGKTITLKVLAEGFSDARVPVFLIDVKGDLSQMAVEGENNDSINARITKLHLNDFEFKKYPTTFFDVFEKNGLNLKIPVKSISTKMFAKLLNLTSAQEGVLSIIFKIAKDENIDIITLEDLRNVLNYIGNKRNEYTLKYGNITSQSIGAIQRSILSLNEDGGDILFKVPEIDVHDFIHFDTNTGQGQINILDATSLFNHPTLYATVVLTIFNKLYTTMDEVGDEEKPRIVFFFDEAHLVFSEMTDLVLKQFIQMVKLIRSKGIGLYFISQSPGDLPDEILSQLGNRIQHVLRSYTPSDEKVIKSAANSFRANPNFKCVDEIKTLGTGEALISFLNESGEPNIVDRFTILPPQSKMGIIDNNLRTELINNSYLYPKYNVKPIINNKTNVINEEIHNEIKPQVSMSRFQKTNSKPIETNIIKNNNNNNNNNSTVNKELGRIEKKVANKVENKIINKVVNKLFK